MPDAPGVDVTGQGILMLIKANHLFIPVSSTSLHSLPNYSPVFTSTPLCPTVHTLRRPTLCWFSLDLFCTWTCTCVLYIVSGRSYKEYLGYTLKGVQKSMVVNCLAVYKSVFLIITLNGLYITIVCAIDTKYTTKQHWISQISYVLPNQDA